MANNVNPFTGRKSGFNLETPSGYIYFDDEDGLLWGDTQIAPGVDANKLFQQLCGKDRPDTYKSYLAKLTPPADDGNVDQTEANSAADVLADDTLSQVVVTNAKALDFAELSGFPGSVSAGAIESTTQRVEPSSSRPSNDQVNLGTLGGGASKKQSPPMAGEGGNTPETAAARLKADQMAGVVQTGESETDAAKQTDNPSGSAGPDSGTGGADVSKDGK